VRAWGDLELGCEAADLFDETGSGRADGGELQYNSVGEDETLLFEVVVDRIWHF
jgi:hypothetical protein